MDISLAESPIVKLFIDRKSSNHYKPLLFAQFPTLLQAQPPSTIYLRSILLLRMFVAELLSRLKKKTLNDKRSLNGIL